MEEPESAPLRAELTHWGAFCSSSLLAVETVRACRRLGGDQLVDAAKNGLTGVALIPIDEQVVNAAQRLDPPLLRTLDAIHLATALSIAADIEAMFCYDVRLAEAASAAGLTVLSPR